MFNSMSFNLQFSNFYCNSYSFNEKGSNFDFVSTKDISKITCPFCGSKVHIYDNSTVRLKDMPMFSGVFNSINISIHRYRCTSCNSSFSEELPFKHPGTRITNRLTNYIKSFLKHRMSIKDISEITGVHWDTISKIHKAYMKEELTRLFNPTDVQEAEYGWLKWFEAAKQSNIPQLERFAILKEKRIPGLVAHARHRISTGPLKGFNNKIKVVKRIGYGYRNDEHFFTMIKYLSIPSIRSQSPRNP